MPESQKLERDGATGSFTKLWPAHMSPIHPSPKLSGSLVGLEVKIGALRD
jgi:hypothetical protein